MRPEDCPFRQDVETNRDQESASCLLAADLVGVPRRHAVRVPRAACELCLERNFVQLLARHPILPSLLLQQTKLARAAASDVATALASDERTPRLERWERVAEATFAPETTAQPDGTWQPACDVIVRIDGDAAGLKDALESVLLQQDVTVWLHLLDARGTPTRAPTDADRGPSTHVDQVIASFRARWNVKVHPIDPTTPTLEAVVRLARQLTSSYLAVQDPYAVSHPYRLARAFRRFERDGAEIVIAATACGGRVEPALDISPDAPNLGADATLVVRRATLIDMALDHPAALASADALARQAIDDERELYLEEGVQVTVADRESFHRWHQEQRRLGELRRRLLPTSDELLPSLPFACDVVLPFHGHLDYVQEALEGLLRQERAECVIHVIDDASTVDTTEFLARCRQHKHVRTYRNRENIGQFQSFNQVSNYFETHFAAIQDADDISLPQRLWRTGQLLEYADADFFAGAVALFSDGAENIPTSGASSRTRQSFYPRDVGSWYFAENPTAAFRTSFFRQLGGFADFGDRLMNRASVDTEFQIRSRFQHGRLALTRDVVLAYRMHEQSATQNQSTGWGTDARTRAGRIVDERYTAFSRCEFDAKSFGSLGRTPVVLERIV